MTSRNLPLLLALFMDLQFAGEVQAKQLGQNEYARLWFQACMAGGESRAIAIGKYEYEATQDMLARLLAEDFMNKQMGDPRTLQKDHREACACIAKRLSRRSGDLQTPPRPALVDSAFDICFNSQDRTPH